MIDMEILIPFQSDIHSQRREQFDPTVYNVSTGSGICFPSRVEPISMYTWTEIGCEWYSLSSWLKLLCRSNKDFSNVDQSIVRPRSIYFYSVNNLKRWTRLTVRCIRAALDWEPESKTMSFIDWNENITDRCGITEDTHVRSCKQTRKRKVDHWSGR